MGAELGRISGPLLAENLLRQGTDLAFETSLLYLDVNTGKVGVNTDSPSRDLTINGTTRLSNGANPLSDLTVDTQLDVAYLTFVDNYIQNASGPVGFESIIIQPNQSADPTIVVNELQTSKLKLSNFSVTTLNANDNINLESNGTGSVVFNTSKVDVNGNLHATGNITFDGSITFGDSDLDNVEFLSDINSRLNPNVNNAFDLGSVSKKWRTLYANEAVSTNLTTPTLTVNDIDMLLTQGNVLYVSANGDDSNTGTHPHDTFRTIKHALSVAVPGDSVVVYAGTFVEDFPLTVPQGVAVVGMGPRSTIVTPSVSTNDKDAFLLNGETTISNLCIRNVFYNSTNDTGYSFRFAPNIKVTSRSPYIQNTTVINIGTLLDVTILDGGAASVVFDAILEGGTSFSSYVDMLDGGTATLGDLLGFNSADAGRGALADGSVAHPDSLEASMLFHAVTFIVPNADGITATNGARVEWLNSFTYFANRGIHLTRGTLGFASLGVRFGAEMRSINSANIYGTYGAVADGEGTLGYLIGHNFGYIGTGANSDNDPSLAQQANEIVAINDGVLYYDSVDHKGDYRIGDIFYVNQQTGAVSFNAQSINFSASGNITLDGPTGQIIVDATKVQVSNIVVHDNNIDSLAGPVNFSAQSGTTTLNTTVNVTGNITTTGDAVISGNVFLGDTKYDLITINPKLTQSINPRLTNTYTLGTKTPDFKVWNTGFLTTLDVDGVIQFTNNTISTLTADTDLELIAAGTGKIKVTSTDVLADNNLTVNGILTVNNGTYLKDTEVQGTTNLTGNIGQTGNTYIIGLFGNNNIEITGTHSYYTGPDIKIYDNIITTTVTDSNLVLAGMDAGGVVLDTKLKIVNNTISNVWSGASTNAEKSIKFSPNGTGNVVLNSTTYLQVPVGNNTTKVLSASGEIRLNSSISAYEGYLSTGNESFNNVYSTDKKTYIIPELSIGNNDNVLHFVVNNTQRATIDSSKITTTVVNVGDFVISGNTIQNFVPNSDTIIQPDGTGSINVNNTLFKDDTITNTQDGPLTLVSTGTGHFKFAGTQAVVFPFGDDSERRNTPESGETRYNTQRGYMEVYNGTSWIPATGLSGAAPLSEVLDIMDFYSLILG